MTQRGEGARGVRFTTMIMTRLFIACALVLELAALCYGTLMAWFVSVWFLDDAVAVEMHPNDWWAIAGERFALCTLAAALVACCILLINRWLARVVGQPASRWPLVTAALFMALPVCASLAGALQFGFTKPYM